MNKLIEKYKERGFVIVPNVMQKQAALEAAYNLQQNNTASRSTGLCKINNNNATLLSKLNKECLPVVQEFYKQVYGCKSISLKHGLDRFSIRSNETGGLGFHLDTKIFPEALELYSKEKRYDGKFPYRVQGVLYLTPCDENGGGTSLVPYMHKYPQLLDLIKTKFPEQKLVELKRMYGNLAHNVQFYILENAWKDLGLANNIFKPITVTAEPGDLLLFDQRLVHGTTPVKNDTYRVTVYVRYLPNEI